MGETRPDTLVEKGCNPSERHSGAWHQARAYGLTRQRLSPRFACTFADFVEAVPESADGHEDSLESLFWLWMDGWDEEDWPFDGDPPEDLKTDIFDQ